MGNLKKLTQIGSKLQGGFISLTSEEQTRLRGGGNNCSCGPKSNAGKECQSTVSLE